MDFLTGALLQVDADCLESDKVAKEACKQLALRLGAKEVEEKQAFRSLEGVPHAAIVEDI